MEANKNQIKKKTTIGILLFILFFAIILLSFIRPALASMKSIRLGTPCGFAVDSEERVYIGFEDVIAVYDQKEMIREIKPPTLRKYCFFIEDDKLIIGIASIDNGGVYSLEGTELSIGEMEMDYRAIEKKSSMNRPIMVNGHQYMIKNTQGIFPYTINRDGEEIMRMSDLDYFFNGLPYYLVYGFFVLAIAFLSLVLLSMHEFDDIKRSVQR